jgi:uncharacterized protein YidB (DUF937 family)
MGLLDNIKGLFGQDVEKTGVELGSQALHSALGDSRFGDLTGLLQHLSDAGLGGQVSSWLNPRAPNQPVSADQIAGAIGGGELSKIGSTLGVSPETASQFIAQHLPNAAAKAAGSDDGPQLH